LNEFQDGGARDAVNPKRKSPPKYQLINQVRKE
jgi:hypothetical protein